MSPKILKPSSDSTVEVLHRLFNEIRTKDVFWDNLKLAYVTPVFRKDDPFNKENYRPASVLRTISKIYENLMQRQQNNYITNNLYPYLCGYRKSYNPQQALASLTKKWKMILNNKGFGRCCIDVLVENFWYVEPGTPYC